MNRRTKIWPLGDKRFRKRNNKRGRRILGFKSKPIANVKVLDIFTPTTFLASPEGKHSVQSLKESQIYSIYQLRLRIINEWPCSIPPFSNRKSNPKNSLSDNFEINSSTNDKIDVDEIWVSTETDGGIESTIRIIYRHPKSNLTNINDIRSITKNWFW